MWENPDQMLANTVNRKTARYNDFYIPIERQAVDSIKDKSLIQEGLRRATDERIPAAAIARQERDAARFGMINNDPLARAEQARGAGLNRALYVTNTMNNALMDQYSRNTAMRNEMLNIGRGVASEAQDNMQSAATAQHQREAANDAAKANAKAAKQAQTQAIVGTVVTIAVAL